MTPRIAPVAARFGRGAFAIAVALAAMSSVSSAEDAKPAAAAPAPAAPAAPAAVNLDKGRELFSNYGCGSCHTLSDAGASGDVGPSLDGDPNLTLAFVTNRVTNGQGAMPSFAGQFSDDEMSTLAAYVVQASHK